METTMNHAQHSTRARKGRATPLMAAAIASTALLALCIADASAARGGGRGGGHMANSSVSGANRASYGGNRANAGYGNRGNVNTGNVNRGNINTGNINVGNDVNIDIDVDGRYGYGSGYRGGYYYRPVATAAVIGAVAVTTAAVLGSYYYSLPPGCSVVYRAGVSYHYCGSVYYQQSWSGDQVVYVVVAP
jgi:hypothetical protein